MNNIKHLLEKWATLEPHLCRHYVTNDMDIFTFQLNGQWNLLLSDNIEKLETQMKVQWAIQQAIIQKGWSYTLVYDSFYGFGNEAHVSYGTKDEYEYHYTSKELGSTEVLLTVYLKVLEAHVNP